uniref:Uncharacterized protein LOC104265701 n=1 Tax=Phallusia mammillata TaxID=59560 RepID=A0A6F9DJE8_9ASCI|nr:uncharacterized protein LOC104265701 [Phallusia mammillata]
MFYHRDPSNKFKDRIKQGKAFICSSHFNKDDIQSTTKRKWIKFGRLPSQNLPQKCFTTSISSRRIIRKHELPLKININYESLENLRVSL